MYVHFWYRFYVQSGSTAAKWQTATIKNGAYDQIFNGPHSNISERGAMLLYKTERRYNYSLYHNWRSHCEFDVTVP